MRTRLIYDTVSIKVDGEALEGVTTLDINEEGKFLNVWIHNRLYDQYPIRKMHWEGDELHIESDHKIVITMAMKTLSPRSPEAGDGSLKTSTG